MNSEIGVGLIVGAVAASSFYIWESDNFTKGQKIFLLICIVFPPAQWILAILIYFYNSSNISPLKFNLKLSSRNSNTQHKPKKPEISTDEQIQSIQILKDKGLLTDSEYQEKINIIEEKKSLEELYASTEYSNLKKLYESGILTQDEFNLKVETIKNNRKEELNTLNNTIKYEYENSDFYGLWFSENAKLHFYEEYGIQKIEMNWNNGRKMKGHWDLTNSILTASMYKTFGTVTVFFNIKQLSTNYFIYSMDGTEYTARKN